MSRSRRPSTRSFIANLICLTSLVVCGLGHAEDGERTFGDEELDRQIQNQWEALVGSESAQEERAPILRTQSTQTVAGEPEQEATPTSLEVLEDDGTNEVGYNDLMEEITQDTLLTPIQIDRYRIQQFQNLIIQNKSIENGYVGITQNKKGNYELRVFGLDDQPASGAPNLFDVENSKLFVKIKHHSFERLLGYYNHWLDSEIISYKVVRLKKDYEAGKTFWSRWNIVPVLGEDWYLLQSYYDPKKCMTVKGNQKMVIRNCKTVDERQHWRFVKKPGFGVEDLMRDPDFPIL